MRHIAIIGSGPAGYYTAEAAQKQWGDDVRVDVFDFLPVPYGLIRTGVAPDHQSIKGVSRRYESTALSDNVRFVGNVMIGRDVSVPELQALYDAVVFATGAPNDKPLGIPGDDLANVFGSAAFVGWYNGHPQFRGLDPDLSGHNELRRREEALGRIERRYERELKDCRDGDRRACSRAQTTYAEMQAISRSLPAPPPADE
ncbi:FAD-dependent oxidoreductase [Leptolyngbya sp. 15MV]|nr:FAD-dependent oxidoreductase [Leptolyngbya sp. 15MV]